MAISRQTVGKMNGELLVSSVKGIGTTSIVTLPCVMASKLDNKAMESPVQPPLITKSQESKVQVNALIVDDNTINQ